ncbi:unnamed protein product [Psylliodes chrysocephalus]|uniref:Nose resistant-to-fluoxetine protein N-terminal domain-containing protein n=1 Tax=Psylliodes chrysocephalus TaxID=3402493 RepID=A0A9P0D6E2_9CUCU|nr:unnamed protein product [Psylliodes chrysocephala]
MITFFVILCAFLIWFSSRVNSEPTTSKYTYNSSDLSYLSNGIQFPVAESDIEFLAEDSGAENGSQILWFSRLYDHHRWWNRLEKLENPLCKSDMMVYLRELGNGTSWAVKMFDASGRYSGQFLFGNDYWLGSKTLCKELTLTEWNTEVPPFAVHFYVAKIRINLNRKFTPVTRQLNVGECLPKSCGVTGVRSLLAHERNQATSINIVGVREVPGDYSLLYDFKVHLLGGCTLLVLGLIIISTLADYFIPNSNENSNKTDKANYKQNGIENNNGINNNGIKYISTIGTANRTTDSGISNETKTSAKNGIPLKLLLSFSVIKNGRKILSVEKVSLESIECIHGLRFFSIAWIILVHSYLELFAISNNKNVRIVTERGFFYQTISNATFSVDTFFFISGLLVTLTFFRTEEKKQKPPDKEGIYTAIKKSLNEIIMRYLHSNSVFSPAIIDHISCNNYWWRNILYINNFYPQHEFCMLWSWYMANDTQFYVISTILLLIGIRSSKHIKFVGLIIIIFMGASWITTFIIAMKWEYVARVEEPFALFDQLYDKPWLRIGPYLVGIVAGYFLFKMNCKIKMPCGVVVLGWVLSLACLGSLVYGLGRDGLVIPASAFYAALSHSAWGLSIAWITVACCSGYGGPLNYFLSCELFLPLSRLTYCAYLVHPVLMCLTSFHLDGSFHLHQAMAVVIYFGNLVLSFMTAFAISLAFEAPVVNLLKIIFG